MQEAISWPQGSIMRFVTTNMAVLRCPGYFRPSREAAARPPEMAELSVNPELLPDGTSGLYPVKVLSDLVFAL